MNWFLKVFAVGRDREIGGLFSDNSCELSGERREKAYGAVTPGSRPRPPLVAFSTFVTAAGPMSCCVTFSPSLPATFVVGGSPKSGSHGIMAGAIISGEKQICGEPLV